MELVRARAPVRFCDLGGWTDTRIVPEGAVLNFAATLYTQVTLQITVSAGTTVESLDTKGPAHLDDFRRTEYDSVLELCRAALRRAGIRRGVRVLVRSEAPPASGLGSSAALGVAVVAALETALGRRLLPLQVARTAQALEVEELGLECGIQDQLASARGGVNFMEVNYPEARVHTVPLAEGTVWEMEDRFVLVYTGKSHFSSRIHQKVIAEYEAGRNQHVFSALAECAVRGKEALLAGDLESFGAVMNENWEAQKALHPEITTSELNRLAEVARSVGAIGFKANGVGGGGTATLLCRRGKDHRVRAGVRELGMQVLPARVDRRGLRVWRVE